VLIEMEIGLGYSYRFVPVLDVSNRLVSLMWVSTNDKAISETTALLRNRKHSARLSIEVVGPVEIELGDLISR
jgi:hypothetical protein